MATQSANTTLSQKKVKFNKVIVPDWELWTHRVVGWWQSNHLEEPPTSTTVRRGCWWGWYRRRRPWNLPRISRSRGGDWKERGKRVPVREQSLILDIIIKLVFASCLSTLLQIYDTTFLGPCDYGRQMKCLEIRCKFTTQFKPRKWFQY